MRQDKPIATKTLRHKGAQRILTMRQGEALPSFFFVPLCASVYPWLFFPQIQEAKKITSHPYGKKMRATLHYCTGLLSPNL